MSLSKIGKPTAIYIAHSYCPESHAVFERGLQNYGVEEAAARCPELQVAVRIRGQSTAAPGVKHALVSRERKGRHHAVAHPFLAHEARPQHDRRAHKKRTATAAAPMLNERGTGFGRRQVHGGIAQGAGQALMERATFDEHGQLLTASLMDYALPRADNLPSFDFETRNVASTINPMGLKGAGEAGSIGSTPAVMNAIADALWRAYGVDHIDMPATAFAVYGAI
jgi:CO/xanthine dehydrogenase Mo-binding subunit